MASKARSPRANASSFNADPEFPWPFARHDCFRERHAVCIVTCQNDREASAVTEWLANPCAAARKFRRRPQTQTDPPPSGPDPGELS